MVLLPFVHMSAALVCRQVTYARCSTQWERRGRRRPTLTGGANEGVEAHIFPPCFDQHSKQGGLHGRHFESAGAESLDEQDSWQGYETRACCPKVTAFHGLPVPVTPPGSSRQSRHRSSETRRLYLCPRLFLASAQELQRRPDSQDTDGLVEEKTRRQRRPRQTPYRCPAPPRLARYHDLGMPNGEARPPPQALAGASAASLTGLHFANSARVQPTGLLGRGPTSGVTSRGSSSWPCPNWMR